MGDHQVREKSRCCSATPNSRCVLAQAKVDEECEQMKKDIKRLGKPNADVSLLQRGASSPFVPTVRKMNRANTL